MTFTSNAYAILPAYDWTPATSRFVSTTRFAETFPSSAYGLHINPVGDFLIDSTHALKAPPTSLVPRTLEVLGGTAASAVLARRSVALLGVAGGIGTAVTLVMTAKDIYDWANASPTNKAYFDGVSTLSAVGPGLSVGQIVSAPGTYGGTYQITAGSTNTLSPPQPDASWCSGGSPGACTEWTVYSGYPNLTTRTKYTFQASAPPPIPNAAQSDLNWWYSEVVRDLAAPAGSEPYPGLRAGVDKAVESGLIDGKTETYPTSSELSAASAEADLQAASQAATAAATAATAEQAANVQKQYSTANNNYRISGSAADKAALDAIQLKLDEVAAANAKEAADTASAAAVPLPTNAYDPSIELPDKKSIPTLLTDFLSASPLVAMVQSFRVTATAPESILHIGIIYGQDLSFDFSPWENKLQACGGMLIIIMHGYSILIVIRGW